MKVKQETSAVLQRELRRKGGLSPDQRPKKYAGYRRALLLLPPERDFVDEVDGDWQRQSERVFDRGRRRVNSDPLLTTVGTALGRLGERPLEEGQVAHPENEGWGVLSQWFWGS